MKRNQYVWLAGLCLAAFVQSGCLKKADSFASALMDSGKTNLIELRAADRQRIPSLSLTMPVTYAPDPVEEELVLGYIRLASAEVLKTPVQVRLTLNNAALPTGYLPLPANAYSLVTPLDNIVLPAETRFVAITAVIKKQLLDPAEHYGLRFEIESAGAGTVVSSRTRMMMISVEPEE